MRSETTIVKSKALFSDDREHRLLLRKEWDRAKKTAMVIMINPNTADTLSMDMTTMLVINNLSKLGFGTVNIVNLYSRISTKLALRFNSDEDLLHEENDTVIAQYAAMSDAIIIAWGSAGVTSQRVRDRQSDLLNTLSRFENKMYQIGKEGYHPLTPVVRNAWQLEVFTIRRKQNADHT